MTGPEVLNGVTRQDEWAWQSKNTLSGLLGGALVHGKRQPTLWSLNFKGQPHWYCEIETNLDLAAT